MRIEVLGPIRVWLAGEAIDLGPTGQRALLGLLAVTSGQPMSRAELVEAVWGDRPPPSATNIIQTRVKNLRRLLEPARQRHGRSAILPAVGDGYALQVPTADIDLHRFRQLTAAAAAAQKQGDLTRAATLMRDALRLWRGRPLADIPFLAMHPKVLSLIEQRRKATAQYGELMIATGGGEDVLPALVEAVTDDPLDEGACARLIRAYQAAGRRAEAFDTYHETRRRLADELGIDPGPELTAAHAALLEKTGTGASRALATTPRPVHPSPEASAVNQATAVAVGSSTRRPVPAQLPADIPNFIGRSRQLRQLNELSVTRGRASTGTMLVAVLSGSAGAGKTALAVHWAHQIREQFPDGQLYVNLGGFGPAEPAMKPADVMQGFLDAFGVPAEHMPTSFQALTGLYRSVLSEKQTLIVLDNALDAEQVRPLLPGAPRCAVLVTSRNRLASLVATERAYPLALDLLSSDEARDFMAHRVGPDRVAAESGAVEEIITVCARLPLALAIVAARATVDPQLTLGELAHRLREARSALDALTHADRHTDVRGVFSWSYRLLSPPAARLFRLLALHPRAQVGLPAAASLGGASTVEVRSSIDELIDAHLVAESNPGRYTMHDLLRAYANELLGTLEPEAEQRAATRRLLDHYLLTAHAAAMLLNPYQYSLTLPVVQPGVTPESLGDEAQAFAWYVGEQAALVAAVGHAAALHLPSHAWRLAATLEDFLNRRGHWHDWAATQRIALTAGELLADTGVQARANRGLARAHTRLGRYAEANACFARAAELYAELGDDTGLAHTYLGTSYAVVIQGDCIQAIHHARQALARYRTTGDTRGRATALHVIGLCLTKTGNDRRALSCYRQALSVYQRIGDREGEADTWDSLGRIHHRQDEYQWAAQCFQRAVELYEALGDRHYAADTLVMLGRNHLRMGDPAAAREAWRRALNCFDELGPSELVAAEATKVRVELQQIEHLADRPDHPVTITRSPGCR